MEAEQSVSGMTSFSAFKRMDVGTEPSDSNDFTSTPSGAFTGMRTVNTEPSPTLLTRLMLPLRALTICLTSASPTPEPTFFLSLSV